MSSVFKLSGQSVKKTIDLQDEQGKVVHTISFNPDDLPTYKRFMEFVATLQEKGEKFKGAHKGKQSSGIIEAIKYIDEIIAWIDEATKGIDVFLGEGTSQFLTKGEASFAVAMQLMEFVDVVRNMFVQAQEENTAKMQRLNKYMVEKK